MPIIAGPAINLSLEASFQSKKDYKQLQERMLNAYEWDLLEKLIELFKPIEDATEFLGGQKYCTLSLIYPTIQALKYSYANDKNQDDSENSDNENGNNKNNISEDSDNRDGNKFLYYIAIDFTDF